MFWKIAKIILSKGKLAIPPLFNGPEVLSFAYAVADLFPKLFDSFSTCFPF